MMRSVRLKMHENVQNLISDYAESELPVNLHTVYADQMYAQVWPDAKMSLLSNSSSKNPDEPVPATVWELIKEMDRFYNFLCEFRPLPPCEVGVWAMPFVDRWLRSLEKGSRRELILAAIDKKLPANHTSTNSLGSTSRLAVRLKTIVVEFKELPYNQDHLQRFTMFLTKLFDRYLVALTDCVQRCLDSERVKGENWGYVPGHDGRCQVSLQRGLFEKLNDVYAIPEAIQSVRAQLDLESLVAKSYDPSATLRRQSAPQKFEGRTLKKTFDTLVNTRVPQKCEKLCSKLVEGMTLYPCDRLSKLVSGDKLEALSKQDLYEGPMQPIMNDLIPKFDQFSSLAERPVAREIWSQCWDHLMQHLKKELTPADVDDVPSVMQIRRVSYIADILLKFFKREYPGTEETEPFSASESRREVIDLSEFLVSGTRELIAEFEQTPKSEAGFWNMSRQSLDQAKGETETGPDSLSHTTRRRRAHPLLQRRALWFVLRHRAESLHDSEAVVFVLKNQSAEDSTRDKLRRQLSQRSQRSVTESRRSPPSSNTQRSVDKFQRSKTVYFFGRPSTSAKSPPKGLPKPRPKKKVEKKSKKDSQRHKRSRSAWFFWSSRKLIDEEEEDDDDVEDATSSPASPPRGSLESVESKDKVSPLRRSNATRNLENDTSSTAKGGGGGGDTTDSRKYMYSTFPRRSLSSLPHMGPPRKQSSHKDVNAVMQVIDQRRQSSALESP